MSSSASSLTSSSAPSSASSSAPSSASSSAPSSASPASFPASRITHDPDKIDAAAARELGLKSGIEIHQQLATRKLFCRCPSTLRDDEPDYVVVRKLRASAGESGDIDQAALHERLKNKEFHYQGYEDTTCLVEVDEEPPHPLNEEALEVAVQVMKLLDMTILPRAQVMRKTVIDGSNTSGFQRTVLLGFGGAIEVNKQKVGIQTLCLEEDAAKVIKRTPKFDLYNLSRLGIPLIEIATEPDLDTPEAIRDAAAYLGMLLRSTRKAKRGLGTIRQDVNVSVTGGTRVEIKGAQDLRAIPDLARKEAARQAALVALAKELSLAGLTFESTVERDVTKECSGSKSLKGFLKKALEKGDRAIAVGLPGLKGIPGTELYPGYRVGTELAGYAKTFGFGGIIHSDEKPETYGIDFDTIRKALGLKKEDAFVILVGDDERARDAITHALIPRIEQLWNGVPSEVRKANADATTTFLRPMPGAARMYPETDIPDVDVARVVQKVVVPQLLTEQYAAFAKKHGLPLELAKEAIEVPEFEEYVARYTKLKPAFIAEALIVYPKEIKKREQKELAEHLGTVLSKILEHHNTGEIPKDAVYELMVDAVRGRQLDFSKYKGLDESEVEKVVDEIIAADPGAPLNALMGQAMVKLRGKANGKTVMALLQKKLNK